MVLTSWYLCYGTCVMVIVLWYLHHGTCAIVLVLWHLCYGLFHRMCITVNLILYSCKKFATIN